MKYWIIMHVFHIRISAICFCRMDLSLYPFDEQRCLVHFEARETCILLTVSKILIKFLFSVSYQEDELVYVDPHAHLAPNATLPTRFSLTIQPVNSSSQKYHGGGTNTGICCVYVPVPVPVPVTVGLSPRARPFQPVSRVQYLTFAVPL
jgi:hypothetical protein